MASYDLRIEQWIPVRFCDGTVESIGLSDALIRAHEISEIASDSPVETAALNRLLLALAVRIFPETEKANAWFERWETGQFDSGPVDKYFEQWKDRFDLLHPVRPFYQVREKVGGTLLRVGMLRLDESSYNQDIFSHGSLKMNMSLSCSEATRGVIATQMASIGGTQSNAMGASKEESKKFRYTNHAPFISGSLFWLRGNSLFEALLLNAPPNRHARMGGMNVEDLPAWETREVIRTEIRSPKGFLDYLTFQHRRITLEFREPNEGHIEIIGVRITNGDTEDGATPNDPHMSIRTDNVQDGKRVFNFGVDRMLWRDSAAFLTTLSERGTPPETVTWLASQSNILGTERFRIDVTGLRLRGGIDAKLFFWRRESMPFFGRFLQDEALASYLKAMLERAEDQFSILRNACFITAKRVLFSGRDDKELSSDDRESARKVSRALDAETRYWSSLEQPFYAVLHDLSAMSDPEEVLRQWTERIHRAALNAFDTATSSLVASGKQLRAAAEGRAALRASRSYKQPTPTTSLTPKEVSG